MTEKEHSLLDLVTPSRSALKEHESPSLALIENVKETLSSEQIKNTENKTFFAYLDHALSLFIDFEEGLDSAEKVQFKKRFREALLPLFNLSPFNYYCLTKPRGYAGDFVMMDMIWENRTEKKESTSNHLNTRLDDWIYRMPNCAANEERIHLLSNFLSRHSNAKTIASIGCGAVIELLFFLSKNSNHTIQTVHLYDQDEGALECAKQKLSPFQIETVTHKGNILKSILSVKKEQYDLIYSSGLFDYFETLSCKKIASKLWKALKSKGNMCIINANPENPSRFWMEYAMDWELKYKDMNEFMSIFTQLGDIEEYVLKKDKQGIYQYSYIQKS